MPFNVVSRHPEAGRSCALCGREPGHHRAEEFVRLVVERRSGATVAEGMRECRDAEDDR